MKAQMRLLPWGALRTAAGVLTFGAKKYADNPEQWRSIDPSDHLDAAFRHLSAHAEGVEFDDESNLPHLAHAVCRLLFILDLRSKVKGQSIGSFSISREILAQLSTEEIRAIFEDRKRALEQTEPSEPFSSPEPTAVL